MVKLSSLNALRKRFNISRLAIKYSRVTIGFWIAMVVAGLLAFSSLKYALFPDITFPVVVVNAQVPLETALETEQKLTQPIEERLFPLAGLDQMVSSTYPGRTVVTLYFHVGTDLNSSSMEVEKTLWQIALPEGATFQVIPFNLNESSAVSYTIKSDTKDLKELAEIAKTSVLPEIAQLPGVLKVNLLGGGETTFTALNSGSDLTKQAPEIIKEEQRQDTPESPIPVTPTRIRFNGQEALAFQVIKGGDANTLDVVSRVEETVQRLQGSLPGVQLVLAVTQANYIREATQSTIDGLVLAIVLAVLVIFTFLRNWRATLITALAIPISLLGTAIVMAIYGFNLETITLLALALVIGIIIDDAIVEVENISRHLEAGESPRQAALSATNEIGLTVSASTLTIVAVFLPVGLMGGNLGQFFKPFGLTVSAAVLTSLLVARTLCPVLAVYWLKPRQGKREQGTVNREKLSTVVFDFWLRSNPKYPDLLRWSLGNRKFVVALAVLSLVAGISLIPLIPQGFIPTLDRGEFMITYTAPLPQMPSASQFGDLINKILNLGGFDTNSQESKPLSNSDTNSDTNPDLREQLKPQLSKPKLSNSGFNGLFAIQSGMKLVLNQSEQVAKQLEEAVLAFPEVESVYTVVGVQGEPNKGNLQVKLKRNRQYTTAQVQEKMRAALPKISGVTTSVEDIQFIELPTQKPVQVALLGDDLEVLGNSAADLKNRIETLPGLVDVEATGQNNRGNRITEIEHVNGQRGVYVRASLNQGHRLGDATEEVVKVAKLVLPDGVRLQLWGDSALSSHVLGSFAGTLTLSVTCMLLVLILPFGRLLEPMVVGLSLPLSIVGAMLALLITQSDFGMISLIGLIFLLGLLDKNALLLMDYVNQLRRGGLSRTEAILETGVVRLRPIIMTTASTILGMLPLALGFGAGAELRQPMAVAIIGGLLTSTLLSLIVVPVLYSLLEDCWVGLFSGIALRASQKSEVRSQK
ncbi:MULTISPECIES: efflux RND transporter permease subunit [Moorena]|uniref:Cation/multidrug efflux pump n=1 Tax=Moorena producens 3L TaxID=489825 RepID=F4XJG6_9CYAN|nr:MULTISPECIES: efflux RND transporter permease subunit [Moorena]EGJ35246.1 cation/multidrug efflux pump [Moorena producens 3L]NEP69290.1 efflux RND transporter permease subunit [Moorena sp. SIO3A5]NER89626.1 efflux RND transporter permease subunit [Moorena sp. SIO3A2]OLT65699.1 cation transporter [Moorena producens 3L]